MKQRLILILIIQDVCSYLSAPERIISDGYPMEIYEAQTEDGYFLTLHRIPYSYKSYVKVQREVAIFIHGFACSSDTFLVGGPRISLAYQSVDAGFDVWIPNLRGNKYSKKHKILSNEDEEFWNFNLQDLGFLDITASVDFISKKTNQSQIHYIGYSLGTTLFYIWLSEKPEYNKFVKSAHLVSSVAFIGECTCPQIRVMALFYDFFESKKYTEFMAFDKFVTFVKERFCDEKSLFKGICKFIIDTQFGFDFSYLNESLIQDFFISTPSGTSTNILIHFLQMLKSGKFQKYDFGLFENIYNYGQISPPEYNLDFIIAPVYMYYAGDGDFLSSRIDVEKTIEKLPNVKYIRYIDDPEWSHVDFILAKNVQEIINNVIIGFMKKGL